MVTSIPVETTRRRRHMVRAALHLVPIPPIIPIDVRMAAPLNIPRVLVLLQHGVTPVPLGIEPLVPPLEVLKAELVRIATPVLAGHEILDPRRALGYVGGAGFLVPFVTVGRVPPTIQAAGGGFFPAGGFIAQGAAKRGFAGGDLLEFLHFGRGGLGGPLTDPLEVVVAARGAVWFQDGSNEVKIMLFCIVSPCGN